MTSYSLNKLDALASDEKLTLQKAGIRTTTGLLKQGRTRELQEKLSERTGMSQKKIEHLVRMSDLMRVKGVGEEYSILLNVAGVKTIRDLRNRRADNLSQRILDENAINRIVRHVPVQSQVARWIDHARKLTPGIE